MADDGELWYQRRRKEIAESRGVLGNNDPCLNRVLRKWDELHGFIVDEISMKGQLPSSRDIVSAAERSRDYDAAAKAIAAAIDGVHDGEEKARLMEEQRKWTEYRLWLVQEKFSALLTLCATVPEARAKAIAIVMETKEETKMQATVNEAAMKKSKAAEERAKRELQERLVKENDASSAESERRKKEAEEERQHIAKAAAETRKLSTLPSEAAVREIGEAVDEFFKANPHQTTRQPAMGNSGGGDATSPVFGHLNGIDELADTFVPKFVGRSASYEAIEKSWDECLKNAGQGNCQSLCTTADSSGTGKSRLLYEVAKGGFARYLDQRIIVTLKQGNRSPQEDVPNLRRALKQQRVNVLIDFSSSVIDSNLLPEARIALRILHSFFSMPPDSLGKFVAWMTEKHTALLTNPDVLLNTIEAVMRRSGSSVMFLGIDNVSQQGSSQTGIVSAIRAVMDRMRNPKERFVFPLMTSVSAAAAKISERKIDWIPLRSLSLGDSKELFPEPVIEGSALAQAIRDCGGHPRTLEMLASRAKDGRTASHITLVEAVVAIAANKAQAVSFDEIAPVLVGRPRHLSEEIPGTGKDLRSLIDEGTYCNDIKGEEISVVPQMAPLRIRIWAQSHGKAQREADVAKIVSEYLLNPTKKDSSTALEFFHFGWELMMGLLREGDRVTLAEHYRGGICGELGCLPFVYKKCEGVDIGNGKKGEQYRTLVKYGKIDLPNKTYKMSHTNPGFDVILSSHAGGEAERAIAVELKSSRKGSKGKVFEDVIRKKWVKTQDQLRAKAGTAVLVFIADRAFQYDAADIHRWVFTDDGEPMRVIVVPRQEELKSYGLEVQYGPSLYALLAR